jgi:prevent-host-death family protein
MRQVPLSEAKDGFSGLLREAGKHDIVITRHGKPAGVLIGFETEDDWFEYRLETDPRFLQRIEKARASLRAGRRIRIEDLDIKTLDIEDLDIETLNIERVDSDKKA